MAIRTTDGADVKPSAPSRLTEADLRSAAKRVSLLAQGSRERFMGFLEILEHQYAQECGSGIQEGAGGTSGQDRSRNR